MRVHENSWAIPSPGSRSSEQPSRFLALGVEPGEGGETAAYSRKDKRLFRVGNRLGHDSPAAVRKQVETPELFGAAGEGGQHDELRTLSGGQRPVRSGNGDFEIGRAEVAAYARDRFDHPLLLSLAHVVGHANVDVTRRPFRRNLGDILW